jgi:hypothetical protein
VSTNVDQSQKWWQHVANAAPPHSRPTPRVVFAFTFSASVFAPAASSSVVSSCAKKRSSAATDSGPKSLVPQPGAPQSQPRYIWARDNILRRPFARRSRGRSDVWPSLSCLADCYRATLRRASPCRFQRCLARASVTP